MMRSSKYHVWAAALSSVFLFAGCGDNRLPTESAEGPSPISPTTPVPSPPSPQAPSPNGDNRRSFVWSEETGFTILPNPPGVVLVSAAGITESGEVAGTVIMDASAGAPIYRGFKWSAANGFTFIVAPGEIKTHVRGIDGQGRIVGYTEWASERQAFAWTETEGFRSLGVPMPYLNVLGINGGVVFGNAQLSGTVAPFRLRLAGGPFEVLRTVSDVGGGLMGTNTRGEAVGYDGYIDHGFGGTSDAVIWDHSGNRTVAYDCKGENDCFAYLAAINSSSVAVGEVKMGGLGDTRVFTWSRERGIEYLNIPPAGYQIGVIGINDDGSILAGNGREGFLMKPSGTVTVIRSPETHRMVQPRAMNSRAQVVGMLF